jgi:hypothetical protein
VKEPTSVGSSGHISDAFGFLPLESAITFEYGEVEPLPEIAQTIAEIKSATHRDGYIYPPRHDDQALHVFQEWGTETERPAHLYRLSPSHVLRLRGDLVEPVFRSADGAFLMYFVGFLFGYRLQFDGWWCDRRLPMQGRRWSHLREDLVPGLLSNAYRVWRSWQRPERVRFTNLLYMHVRSASYEWDWERFSINYMVFDGCYKMAVTLKHVLPVTGHPARLSSLLRWSSMPNHPSHIVDIARLRRELFHEGLWDDSQPGTASRNGIVQADNLARINDRLLFSLAGYRGPYVSAPWWSVGKALI